MPILWEPEWITPATFSLNRGYIDLLAIGWQQNFIVEYGRYTVLQEIPFGGYRFHVRFKERWWNWSSGSWQLQDIFEDVYATQPFDSEPINTGAISIRFGYDQPWYRGLLVLSMPAIDNLYHLFGMPPAPETYWARNTTPLPPLPYTFDPDD